MSEALSKDLFMEAPKGRLEFNVSNGKELTGGDS
jgi:hypothetical protein